MNDTIKRVLYPIQKRNRLNEVYVLDEPNQTNGASHRYGVSIVREEKDGRKYVEWVVVQFQDGPRNGAGTIHGILDGDLLEMIRDRFKGFQQGAFPSEETAKALEHIDIALMYLNKRAEDRAERGVLGKNKV